MNRRILMTESILAASLLAGCASGGQPPATLPTTAAPPGSGAPVVAATSGAAALPSQDPTLAAALLTVHDLPSGWAGVDLSGDTSAHTTSCGALTINSSAKSGLPRRAAATFEDKGDGYAIDEVLESGSAAQVSQAWSGLGSLTSICPTFTITDTSGSTSFHLATRSSAPFGDQARAFTMTAMTSGLTVTGEIVAERKGEVLVLVIALGYRGTVPTALIQQAVSEAAARA